METPKNMFQQMPYTSMFLLETLEKGGNLYNLSMENQVVPRNPMMALIVKIVPMVKGILLWSLREEQEKGKGKGGGY